MKKFHFYLGGAEPSDFRRGFDIGYAIRHGGFGWNRKHINIEAAVKVTLFLSRKKLKSIQQARLHGVIILYHGERYSHKVIIRAIEACQCSQRLSDWKCAAEAWYARAKVERA